MAFSAAAFATWTNQETTTDDLRAIDGAVTTGAVTLCAVGQDSAILLSSDYGANWSAAAAISGNPYLRDISIVANKIFVAGTAAGSGKCYVSSNWASSWTDISDASLTEIRAVDFGSSSNGVVIGGTAAVNTAALYTNNGGTSWSTSITTNSAFSAVHFVDANTVWMVGDGGLIYRSTNGGQTFTRTAEGATADNLRDVHFVDANHGFIVGDNKTFMYTTNGGASWTVSTSILDSGTNYCVFFIDSNTGWLGGEDPDSIISKLTYSGGSWSDTVEHDTGSSGQRYYSLFLADANNGWMAGSDPSSSGIILGQVTSLSVTSIYQAGQQGVTSAPVGFTGNLTVTGTNFQIGNWAASNIAFSGTGVTVNSVSRVSATELTVNISVSSNATAGSRTVTVTNIDGTSADSTFTLSAQPTVTSIDPSSVPLNATQQSVTIHGTGFQTGATVSFTQGISVVSATVNSSLQITAVLDTTGVSSAVTADITVTNTDSGSVTETGILTVYSPTATNPTITSVYPDSLEQGETETLVITGTNFENNATVTFNNTGITINSYDYSRIATGRLDVDVTVSGTAPVGAVTITVSNPGGGIGNLNQAVYTRQAGSTRPTLTAVQPGTLYLDTQNRELYLTGTGFQNGAQVSLNPSSGITLRDVTVVRDKAIRVSLDINQTAQPADVDLTILNPDGGHVIGIDLVETVQQAAKPQLTNNRILVYPNPWNGEGSVDLQLEMTRDDTVQVRAYNSVGQQLLKDPPIVNVTAGENKITLNKNDFWDIPSGIILAPAESKTEKKLLGSAKIMVVR